jgi:hypothetical protein
VVRVDAGLEVSSQRPTEVGAQTSLGHRQWRAEELRTTDQTLERAELADVCGRLAWATARGG